MSEPANVVRLEEVEIPEPGPGEVLVRMRLAPVNPSDINILQGVYGDLPRLPAVGGKEGAGRIEALGPGVTDLQVGDNVAADAELGSWREWAVVPARRVLRLPAGLEPEQAATIFVNPSTAYRMLHDAVELQPGDWVLQNGANSAVGLAVIEIARHLGLKTINLVRRADERRAGLEALGADVVIEDDKQAHKAVAAAAGGAPLRLGLDCIGGDSSARLNRVLAEGGRHVVYGAMSKQGTLASAGSLIFKDVVVQGYWVTRWYRQAGREAVAAMWEELAGLMRAGKLKPAVEASYPLADYAAAIARATESGRQGKILFDCTQAG